MLMVRNGQGGHSKASYSQTTHVGGASTSTKNNLAPTLREPSRNIRELPTALFRPFYG